MLSTKAASRPVEQLSASSVTSPVTESRRDVEESIFGRIKRFLTRKPRETEVITKSVLFVPDVQQVDVITEGQKWSNSGLFGSGGANINFVEIRDKNKVIVRTYERGVENETLSCGTGVTASALAASLKGILSPLTIETKGGILEISFLIKKNGFENIWLEGPVENVFSGTIHF